MNAVEVLSPRTTRAGQRFEPVGELALHSQIATLVQTLPGSDAGLIVVSEMPSPLGIPDFVAIVGGGSWLERRRAAGVDPVVSATECRLLSVMDSTRGLQVSTLANRTGWSTSTTETIVDALVANGAAERPSPHTVRRNALLDPDGIVFAIETKLREWRRAVQQGRSYRTWANNYVIVLGNVGPSAEKKALEIVSADRAGLYASGTWLTRPQKRVPLPDRRLAAFEHIFAAL